MKAPVHATPADSGGIIHVSATEGYRLWAGSYDADLNPLLELEFRTLSLKLNSVAGRTLLDVACGTGRWMAYAAARGAEVTGVDLSSEMLAAARKKPKLEGRLIRADGQCLPFPDRCADIVVCSFSMSYMDCPERIIGEISRVARQGGTILISDLHPAARQMGWRRTFRNGMQVFEIESLPWTTDRLLNSAQSAGLKLKEILEPHFSGPERQIMRKAGKEALFDVLAAIPAVLAVEWERL